MKRCSARIRAWTAIDRPGDPQPPGLRRFTRVRPDTGSVIDSSRRRRPDVRRDQYQSQRRCLLDRVLELRRGPRFRWIVVASQMELLSSIMKTKDSTLDTRRVRSTTFAIGFYCVLDGAFGV